MKRWTTAECIAYNQFQFATERLVPYFVSAELLPEWPGTDRFDSAGEVAKLRPAEQEVGGKPADELRRSQNGVMTCLCLQAETTYADQHS